MTDGMSDLEHKIDVVNSGFVGTNPEDPDNHAPTAEEREVAHLLPYVSIARYVGRYGWITATVTDEETLAAALEWLRESYWLKAPAGLREAAWA